MEELKQIVRSTEPQTIEEKNPRILYPSHSAQQFEEIKLLIDERENFVCIWNAYTSSGGQLRNTFKQNETIQFRVCCAASALLVDLSAEYAIEARIFDLRDLNPFLPFCFEIKDTLREIYFEAVFETQAQYKGLFKFQASFTLEKTGLFHVWDSYYFRVF